MKHLLALLILYFAFLGCEQDLFQEPLTNKSTGNFFSNEGEIESAVNGVYATLQFTGLYNLYLPAMGEIPSDNTFDEVPANDGGRYGQLDEFTTIPSNEVITIIWKDAYIGIQRSNIILNRIAGIPFNNPNTKNARTGEMLFIRALLYFNLVRIFGDVPLVTEETIDPTTYFGQGRSSTDKVYTQIEQDLKDAIELLPAEADQAGRVIKTAAQALLAKVYMTRDNFASAHPLLEAVLESGQHRLLASPAAVFELGNELSEEIIFAVQFGSGVNGNTEGSDAFVQFSPSGTVNGAKGHNLPTRDFIELYTEEDLRKEAYVGITENGTPFCKKYKEPITVPSDGESDWIVLRYADVLLLLAETENELGNPSSARFYLNQVRLRAGLSQSSNTDPQYLAEAIELERRLELIGEGHRWFDLLRTGKAIETVNDWYAENTNLGITIEEHDLLMPVPQSQIDTDPSLVQNPGY